MDRAPQVLHIIDVIGIDAYQRDSGVSQKPGRIFGQKRMSLKILRRVPAPGPSRLDQHGFAREILGARETRDIDRLDIDRLLVQGRHLDGGEVCQFRQLEFRQIFAIGVAVKGRVEIGSGIGNHLDLADLKLGSRSVQFPRRFAAQVVADDWRGKAFVGDEAVGHGVAEIDEGGSGWHGGGIILTHVTGSYSSLSILLTISLVYTTIYTMTRTAKLFLNGRSQAVRLPSEYRFEGSEVFVRRDPATGDVILSRRPESWRDFFAFLKTADVPEDFLSDRDDAPPQKRELF